MIFHILYNYILVIKLDWGIHGTGISYFLSQLTVTLIVIVFSYYEKLSFMDQIDLNDLEKMFNYADLYPTANELKEAKDNVLKCNK